MVIMTSTRRGLLKEFAVLSMINTDEAAMRVAVAEVEEVASGVD